MSPSKSARRRLPLIPQRRDGRLASPTPHQGCGKASVRILTDRRQSATSTALHDGRHHTTLRRGESGPDLGPEGVAVAAEHLRHGERGAWHGRRSVDVLGAFWYGAREQVQRTGGRADLGGRDPQVARGGLQTPMPEQELNGAQVGAGLK